MQHGIAGFPHAQGVHCASTSLANLVRYYGGDWSEEMVFGLGAGIGAYLYQSASFPNRAFIGRCPYLEEEFFRTLGVPFRWESGPVLPWPKIRSCLDRGVPVIGLADLRYLDYYDTVSLFGGHTLVLIGYDDDGNVYVSDMNEPSIQRTSLAGLRRALGSVSPLTPGFPPNQWAAVEPFALPALEHLILPAIRRNAEAMLHPPQPFLGLPALRQLAADFRRWPELSDWRRLALMFYEFVEKRGSGGAAFRRLYSQFLQEAETYVPAIGRLEASARMHEIAERWKYLCQTLMDGCRDRNPGVFSKAAKVMEEIAEAESSLFEQLLTL